MSFSLIALYVSGLFLILISSARALDVVTVNVGESDNDQRIHFKNELVKLALEITKEQYGDYKILENPQRMNISRAFRELEKGDSLSVTFAHTRAEFEEIALPIRVPLRRGLDSYRLLMIRKGDEKRFSNIQTVEQLKQLRVGLSPNWSTYKIMQEQGFNAVDATDYSSMFTMLEKGRFDYIPRALNEVYAELEKHDPDDQFLTIVPDLAIFIPAATYMFVSRKQARIYERLNTGIHVLSITGKLSALTDKYYQRYIERAKMQNRRLMTINHSLLPSFFPNPPIINQCEVEQSI